MYDLHSHILPNMDDGAKTMEMSLVMLQMAKDNGTEGIVATPHVIEGEWLPAWDKILTECETLRTAAQQAGNNIPIFPGGEVAMYREILDLLTGPGAYCINSGRYLLVELPATHIPSFAEEFFFTLQIRGITPILAHPERHPELAKKPEILAQWINTGILAQMNSTSIIGLMGERVMATAELLLTNQMVHVIGSDAHSTRSRNTNLTSAVAKITKLIGAERAHQLLVVNPDQIIHSRDVERVEISDLEAIKRKSGMMSWLSKLWA